MTAELDLGAEYEIDATPEGSEQFAIPEYFDDEEEDETEFDDDDEEALDFDDDDEEDEFDDDDEEDEFFGLGSLAAAAAPSLISAGGKAVSGLIRSATRKRSRRRVRPRNYASRIRGSRSGSIVTKRGRVRARFSKSYVTSSQLKSALSAVRKDVSRVSSRIASTSSQLSKRIRSVSKHTATGLAAESRLRRRDLKRSSKSITKKIDATKTELEKQISDSQQMSLMMSMLGGSSSMDTTTLLLLSSSMGSSSSSSSDMMSNPLMLLALTGSLGS